MFLVKLNDDIALKNIFCYSSCESSFDGNQTTLYNIFECLKDAVTFFEEIESNWRKLGRYQIKNSKLNDRSTENQNFLFKALCNLHRKTITVKDSAIILLRIVCNPFLQQFEVNGVTGISIRKPAGIWMT